ncbi:hypothetical protein SAY86_019614 [Trapa natans]|uniref:Uncharacterized protein n=1 Tax=Trapa natans TaxID=22666 RepID=A0AAN7LM41_TRANT|nr:hypothetical protein SAY86_019614 [Trapa natans]
MATGGEIFEDWDADFLDQVIRVEERALSLSASSSQLPPPPQPSRPSFVPSSGHFPSQQPPPTQALPRQTRLYSRPSSSYHTAQPLPLPKSYSPPRELVQRHVDDGQPSSRQTPDGGASVILTPPSRVASVPDLVQGLEYERLKRELKRISEQLASSEKERDELRKEVKKERDQFYRAHKAVGIQTENAAEANGHQNLSVKLLSIWSPFSDRKDGGGIVPRIFLIFGGLFRCIGADVSSRVKLDGVADGTLKDLGCPGHPQSLSTPDASKVMSFFLILVKVMDGMAELESLLEPLIDLCCLDNAIIFSRALRVMHMLLKHLSYMEQKPKSRDNIKIEGNLRGDDIARVDGSNIANSEFPLSMNIIETSSVLDALIGFGSSIVGSRLWHGQWNHGRILTSSSTDLLPLFELMHRIIKKNREEDIRLEAVCIMNLILMRSSAYNEREKFCSQMVLETVSELLKKECGSHLQIQALHLLFLLLNCPQILDKFCSNSKDQANPLSVNMVLHGVAGCIGSCGSAIDDLQLRRKAIILLAFLGSSGTAGFEILKNHQLPKEANFFMLILQAMLFELDAEAIASSESPEITKERTLIMREGLILLNSLVSNPQYASTCLRVLTDSRDMASLTMDVANRMSQRIPRSVQVKSTGRQIGEPEVVGLAITFRKRVYAYLGDMQGD